MLLAGLMLKLGVYGILRFGFQLCPFGLVEWLNLSVAMPLIGFTFVSYLTCAVNDLKRVVAYTSISHMNFLVIALVAGGTLGFASAIYTMISHAFISMALFYVVGCIYKRASTRAIVNFSGLATSCPKMTMFLTLFLLGNAGLPLLGGFPGEFLSFMAIWQVSPIVFSITLPGFFFIIFSMFRMLAQILGTVSTNSFGIFFQDLTQSETAICYFFLFWQSVGAFVPFFFIAPTLI